MRKNLIAFTNYFFFWIEEGVAYYLTNKWTIFLICAVIAIFPTVLVNWLTFWIWGTKVNIQFIYFLFWCFILSLFIYEIGLPRDVKERIKSKIKEKKIK